MDWKKTLNISAIALVAWLLVVEWNNFSDQRTAENQPARADVFIPEAPSVSLQDTNFADELPSLIDAPAVLVQASVNTRLVTVTTDTFEVIIDTLGGDIVQVNLLQHLTKMAADGGEPFTLLTRSKSNEYIAPKWLGWKKWH